MLVQPSSRRLFINSIRTIRPTQTLLTSLNRRTFAQTAFNMSTITDSVLRDHREVEECYDHIVNAPDDDQRTRWQNQFIWELARHSHAEEIVVYPAFEKHLGAKGKEMAEKDRQEHQVVCDGSEPTNKPIHLDLTPRQLKERLHKFQNLKVQHPDFMPTLDSIMSALREHITEEERDDMPALEKALSSDDSISMAKSFGRTKAIVPSRSHPWAPAKPPMETLAGLPMGVLDHAMDVLRKFPDKKISPNPSTK
ncbi:MAG: hypothetical protein M1823_001430 [Watsoniomyces obsoletus]|nr:MAG: hypothetical protein M1823_001430 [Watsoniomyces obsoletus]